MAQNDDDAERLLSLLIEGDTASDLEPGWKYNRPMSMLITAPVVEYQTVQRGNKVVKVLTPESRKLLKAYDSMRWPVLDTRDPELASSIWQQHAVACMEYQRGLVPAKSAAPAEPTNDGGMTSRPIRIIRR
jgi:hypothetical protein